MDPQERFRRELGRTWRLLGTIDWKKPDFSRQKAFVTAVFAKMAYFHIPEFELASHSSAKIIPCLAYQELVRTGRLLNVEDLLRTADFQNSFVITTKYVVAVGFATPNVIIVALRGTKPLYLSDWKTDFSFAKALAYVNDVAVKFHSGFFLAITDCLEEIHQRIQERRPAPEIPVYVVGHSLGGALAAIGHGLSGTSFYSSDRYGHLSKLPRTDASFTFGMPRYGNRAALRLLSPFHVYNQGDIVPGVPLTWLGFASVPDEYRVTRLGVLTKEPQPKQGLRWWISRAHLAHGVRHHFIERYIRNLRIAAGIP